MLQYVLQSNRCLLTQNPKNHQKIIKKKKTIVETWLAVGQAVQKWNPLTPGVCLYELCNGGPAQSLQPTVPFPDNRSLLWRQKDEDACLSGPYLALLKMEGVFWTCHINPCHTMMYCILIHDNEIVLQLNSNDQNVDVWTTKKLCPWHCTESQSCCEIFFQASPRWTPENAEHSWISRSLHNDFLS